MFYSDSTKGFYDNDYPANKLPGDIVAITDEEHRLLLETLYTTADSELTLDTVTQKPVVSMRNISLDELKKRKQQEIRNAFVVAEESPVADPLGGAHFWHGGYDSAIKLDAARRLALEAGLTQVTFFDTLNVGHVITVADAQTVCLAIGGKYQTDFQRKQGLMVNIEAATTAEQLNLIAW